ncbi:MAG: MMPL family transporter, partial [Solirubrobacterales bacterium]
MARLLHRIGAYAARRKWIVLGAWLIALIVIGGLFRELGANTSNNLELPGTDSQAATDLLAQKFPPQQNGKNPIVFHAKGGKVTEPQNKTAIERSHSAIASLPHVVSAPSPFSQEGAAQIGEDGTTTFIPVLLDIGNEELTEEIAQSFLGAAEPAREAGMEVAAGGQIGSELSEPETESSEVIGLTAAMVILAFTFGTLVAMGLPIVSAVIGLAVGLSLIGLLGHVSEVPSIAPTLATMIGLGVGIDYALFMVSRYRSERRDGSEIPDAIATATATSGTAIVFAGTTVVIALVTLLIAGIPLVTSLGYASAFAVVTAVLAAITLLPAILALVGRHIDSLRLPAFLRPAEKPPERGFWGAWARFVTAKPMRSIAIAALILIPLIVPFFSLELGQEDIGATPKDTTERQAYDLLSAGFGPGYTGPLLVAVDLGSPAKQSSTFKRQYAKAQSLQQELETEQARGTAQADALEAQSDTLRAQSNALKAEAAALKDEAAGLNADKTRLKRSAAKLSRQRRTANELESLVREGAALLAEAAALAK